MNIMTDLDIKAMEDLDKLFLTAFDTNHPAMLSWMRMRFILKAIKKEEKENKYEHNLDMICPYCDYVYEDACDLYGNYNHDGIHLCNKCGREYKYSITSDIFFSTKKIEDNK